jgi:putative colanic acid biosynthesis UDP-glucose lipid carrier transferase
LLDYPVDLAATPPELGELVGQITPSAGPLVVALLRQPVRGPGAVAKRTIDLVLAATAIVVLAPLLLFTAVAIKLDSAGPILFRQMRAGYGQSRFQVWKFRTMRHDAESGVFRQARQADDRVTRVGRVLRRWSIDELPQLFNVLRGEMSLVGPRPHPLPLNERFQPLIPLYNVRHRVHPGITGLAQVNGCRGETDTVEKMAQRVAYDLQYIRTWSIWLDLWIILLTASGRFTHRNAY